jgi:hypothetical protein
MDIASPGAPSDPLTARASPVEFFVEIGPVWPGTKLTHPYEPPGRAERGECTNRMCLRETGPKRTKAGMNLKPAFPRVWTACPIF